MPNTYLGNVLEKGPDFSYKELLEGDERTLIEIETVLELASEVDGYAHTSHGESMGVMVTSERLDETLETLYEAYLLADEETEDEILSIFSRYEYGFEDYIESDEFEIDWRPEGRKTDRSITEKVRDYILNNKDETSLRKVDKLGQVGEYDELIHILSRYDEYRDTGVTKEELEKAFSYLKEDEDILLKIAQSEDPGTVGERAAIMLARGGYEEEIIKLVDSSTSKSFLENISREMVRDGHTEVLKDAFIRSVNEGSYGPGNKRLRKKLTAMSLVNQGPIGLENTEIVESFFIEEEFDAIEALAENADERMVREILAAGRESEKGDKAKEIARENGYDDLLESFKI